MNNLEIQNENKNSKIQTNLKYEKNMKIYNNFFSKSAQNSEV
jgi:hypothetical protein